MDSCGRSAPSQSAAPRLTSMWHRTLRNRLDALVPRGKKAAAALVLVVSTLVAGPASSASAGAWAGSERMVVEAPADSGLRDAERALGARLALGYAGAVSAADAEALVREVRRQLCENALPSDQLLQTTEAVSRRALTEFLARGTPLPVARSAGRHRIGQLPKSTQLAAELGRNGTEFEREASGWLGRVC